MTSHRGNQQGKQAVKTRAGLRVIFLLSLLSVEVAILAGTLVKSWETASADLLMSWRYRLLPSPAARVNPGVSVISIDTETVNQLGRFPAGKWLSREAFCDQLSFFDQHLSPSVLAYDIVFQDSIGKSARRVQDTVATSDTLGRIVNGLKKIADDPGESLDAQTLYDMNDFALEQGNVNMAHKLASISENKRFHTVMGYFFRMKPPQPGGRQAVQTGPSDAAVTVGAAEAAVSDETLFLLDVSIPPESVHFPDEASRQNYEFMGESFVLPSRALLDYCLPGFLNAPPDEDGIMRRVPLVIGFKYFDPTTKNEKEAFVPSLALMASMLHLGVGLPFSPRSVEVFLGREVVIHSPSRGDVRIPVDEKGRMYLNFTAKFADFTSVSFINVAPPFSRTSKEYKARLADKYRNTLNGRLSVVGVDSAGLDIGPCPIESRSPLMVVHLTAANNILNREFIMPLKTRGKVVLWVCLFLAFTLVCHMQATSRLGFMTLIFAGLYITVAFACVCRNWVILPLISPLVFIGTCSLTVLSYRFLAEEKAKRRIRNMFSTMVSDQVLAYLEENPDSFSLRGQNVDATVCFSDVVNFTGISEKLTPERLTDLLNQYLTPATDIIMNFGGYVDKYIGDGIMAVWGAPYPDPDHAIEACRAAIKQQDMLIDLNKKIQKDFGVELSVRIGINSGNVKAGNMGSARKFQYTVIGDVVNLASRLEPANKDFGTRIIAGDITYRMVKDRIVTRCLGKIIVAGKEEAVSIYEIIGEKGQVDGRILEVVDSYDSALGLFFRRSWAECITVLDAILKNCSDGPSLFLRNRAIHYQSNPPDPDWQGEYVRHGKA